jgi:transcriptional regulator with XRE-family HTH domain
MRFDEALRTARTRAGLTQRELARRTGVAQPTIARIERGLAEPRVGTFDRLLAACGSTLAVEPTPGFGIDRTQMRELRKLTPAQRLETLRRDVAGMAALDRAVRR